MFEKVKPEQVGVSSCDIKKYISMLENARLSTHSIIMMRHGKVFYENYWKPFDENFLHRMYSVSKSLVGIAVGFLEQDGLISLDDKIIDYFDADITENACETVKMQTIRNMLMMSTGYPWIHSWWFGQKPADRLKHYFDSSSFEGGIRRIPGTIFEYDSMGSFVLGSMVEEVTGKSLMEYLREKLFDKIGVSKEAYCLKCPGGHSWGDSAILCTARDLAKVLLFVMNKGEWMGEQILNREYLETAASSLIDTNEGGFGPNSYGYGYQIWRTSDNSFYFNGMGCQYAIAIPDKDMVFVINSDNQGNVTAASTIINPFFEIVANNASDEPIAENEKAYDELVKYSESLSLFALKGGVESSMQDKINGKLFKMNENPMGITEIKLVFEGGKGVLEYKNAQGDKKLYFGMEENAFGVFPQEGYADMVGTEFAAGNYYKCAASAMWTQDDKMEIAVQAIDKYFGRLLMRFAFPDENTIAVNMNKAAEDFFDEYSGYADGKAE